MKRCEINKTKRWVIKIGSALLTNDGKGLDKVFVLNIVKQIVQIREHGIEVILVSSGAVAEGMKRLNWVERPSQVSELQAAAAVGQMGLIKAYESKFDRYGINTAQVLLTHDDLSNRQRYLNARGALQSLLSHGVVPVVNENDTVITDEIRFGDNDTLAALVANLVGADLLLILTDQEGLFDADPRVNPNAKLLASVQAGDPYLEQISSGGGGKFGTGGMLTKVKAAKRAARSGTATIIAYGKKEEVIFDILNGKEVGTLLMPDCLPMDAKKRWIASHLRVCGSLILDDGAINALLVEGKSLLGIGVVESRGDFSRGDVVSCFDVGGNEVARGMVNYNSVDVAKIIGKPSSEIEKTLGFILDPEIIHRDNLVLI